MDDARREAARVLGVKESAVQVTPLESSTPGLTLLGADAGGDRGPRKFVPAAILSDGKVVVGGEPVRRALIAAWGPARPPAERVAAVISRTLDLPEVPKVVTDPARVAYLQKLGVQGVALPHDDVLDGRSTVVWWVQTGSNPATEVILRLEGEPTVTYGRTHGGG